MNEENVNNPYAEGMAQRRGLVERAKNMIVKPKLEWGVVAAESPDVGGITVGYALPLIILSAIASMIGYGLVGVPGLGRAAFSYGIAQGVTGIISGLVGLYIAAGVMKILGPTFDSTDDFGRAFQLVAYSYTPIWVAGVLMIVPPLGAIAAFAGLIYSIYLFYIGLTPVMGTPQNRVVAYIVVAAIVMIVVTFVLALVLAPIIFGIFGLSMIGGAMF